MEAINYQKDTYLFYLRHVIANNVSKDKQDLYARISSQFCDCFTFSKQDKLPEAHEAYKECCRLKDAITPDILSWIKVFCQPYLAYFHFKMKNYEESISSTYETIESARQLQNSGYRYLFFVEIQQFHNLSRIYFKLGDLKRAIAYSAQCIMKIANNMNKWTTDKLIDDIPEIDLIEITQYEMIIQVTVETINRLIGLFYKSKIKLKKWFDVFFRELVKIRFGALVVERRYSNLDIFYDIMNKLNREGLANVEGNILYSITEAPLEKELLSTIYNYLRTV